MAVSITELRIPLAKLFVFHSNVPDSYTLFANETALIKLASLLNPKFQSFKIAVSLANGVYQNGRHKQNSQERRKHCRK
jgi:hypothetical protein